MKIEENTCGLNNYYLTEQDDHSMVDHPPGYELVQIVMVYQEIDGERSYKVTQKTES